MIIITKQNKINIKTTTQIRLLSVWGDSNNNIFPFDTNANLIINGHDVQQSLISYKYIHPKNMVNRDTDKIINTAHKDVCGNDTQ